VNGSGFVPGAVVNWNGSARGTTFVSTGPLKAAITAADIAMADTAAVTVTNPGTGINKSNVTWLQVTSPDVSIVFSSTQTTNDAPGGIADGDFNEDGLSDLVATNGNSDHVSLMLNNGDGTFTTSKLPQKFWGTFEVAVGDLNNDGHDDVALVTYSGGSDTYISVHLGNGDGTFRPEITSSIAPNGVFDQGMVLADFNQDGNLDVAIASFDQSAILIALGHGDGSFASPTLFNIPVEPWYIAAGDFNHDGKLDLLTRDVYGNALYQMLGNGDGTFQPAVAYPVSDNYVYNFVVADFNGDGNLDAVVSGSDAAYGSHLYVLFGNYDGSFQSPVDYPSSPW
jgi:hypothetical protein